MATTISLTEGRRKIFDLAQAVQTPNRHYILTVRGKPKVALLSADEYETIMETLEVMRDFPDLDKEYEIAKKEFEEGDYWILEDSGKIKKHSKKDDKKKVQGYSVKQSKKRS